MRNIICLTFLILYMIASAQGAIGLPEFYVLYSGGWDNKVVVGYTGMKSSSISVSGGTAVAANWSDGNSEYSGYFVRVSEGVKTVSITLTGKNEQGKLVNFGTYKYRVKPFPGCNIQTTTISKSSGCKVNISLGPDSPFTGLSLVVTRGTINGVPFVGDLVPGMMIGDLIVGNQVEIEVFYSRNGVMEPTPAKGILKVTN
jgi:hypothetical protein